MAIFKILAFTLWVCAPFIGCGGVNERGGIPSAVITTRLLITSSPGGAEIWIDGNNTKLLAFPSGSQPTEVLNLSASPTGTIHLVTLKRDGYYDWNTVVMLFPESTVFIDAQLVSRNVVQDMGTLRITSEPSGAQIFIDGHELNETTPVELTDITPTKHVVRLVLAGVGEVIDSVEVKPNAIAEFHAIFDDPDKGSISGTVYNTYGDTLVDAEVELVSNGATIMTTRTTLFGSFEFRNVTPGVYTLKARANASGIDLEGQRRNIVVISGRRTFNADITVVQSTATGTVVGRVTDRNGRPVEGAYVSTLVGLLASTSTTTDAVGEYRLENVLAGSPIIEVMALGYQRARQIVQLTAGGQARLDFTLTELSAELGEIPTPTGFGGLALTYPATVSRNKINAIRNAFLAFLRTAKCQRLLHRLSKLQPRISPTRIPPKGNFIEADIWWDPISREDIAGYKVYRSVTDEGGFVLRATLWETSLPLFADIAPDFTIGARVRYAVSMFSVLGNEGKRCTPITLVPLNALRLKSPADGASIATSSGEQIKFQWEGIESARAYWVQVFSEFPSGAVDPIWTSVMITPPQAEIVYDGPPPLRGKVHYWLVIAADTEQPDEAKAFAYSELRRFTVK